MATKLENLDLETAHFHHVKEYFPAWTKCDQETIDILLEYGVLQVSTFYEHAVAHKGGYTVVSEDTHDFDDYGDGKLCCVRTSSNGTKYSAPIKNINGKIGTLRVQVYERKQNKFYYFAIPKYAYEHIPKTSNIEIPFELDGTPRKFSSRPVIQNWWQFEEPTFEAMCKKTY